MPSGAVASRGETRRTDANAETIPPARGTRPAPSVARLRSVEREERPEHLACPATAFRLALDFRTNSTRWMPLSRDLRATRRAMAWASVRRVSNSTAAVSARSETVWSHARLSRSPANRAPPFARGGRANSKVERADQLARGPVTERVPPWKRTHRQVQADNGADPRRDEDVQATARARAQCGSALPPRCRRPQRRCQRSSRRRLGPRGFRRPDRRAGAGRGGRHGRRETPASAHPERARSPADQLVALPARYHRTMTLTDATFEEHLDATRDERLESYKAFLRIPSISALPEHRDDCRATASGLPPRSNAPAPSMSALAETSGHPVVYADWLHAGPDAPTVLVYGHYDVQPVDPLDLWTSPPFEPVVVGGRMLARGAADDKGQIHAPRHGRGGLLATRGSLPVNVQLRVRGRGGDRLASPRRVARRPTGTASRRTWRSSATPASSRATCRRSPSACAASCTPRSTSSARRSTSIRAATAAPSRTRPTRSPRSSRRSRVRTGGSASRASTTRSSALTDEEREAFAALPFDEEAYRTRLGVPALVGEAGFTTLERRGARPTLDVNGIWGGFQGEGSKTIIPAHAHAKVELPARPRPGPGPASSSGSGTTSREIAPPGVTVDGRVPRRRAAEP